MVTNPLTFDSGPGVLAGTQVLPRVGGRVSCPPLCPGSPAEVSGTDGTTPQGPVLAVMLVTRVRRGGKGGVPSSQPPKLHVVRGRGGGVRVCVVVEELLLHPSSSPSPSVPRHPSHPVPLRAAWTSGVYYTSFCAGYSNDTSVCMNPSRAQECAVGYGDDCQRCPQGALCPGGYRVW